MVTTEWCEPMRLISPIVSPAAVPPRSDSADAGRMAKPRPQQRNATPPAPVSPNATPRGRLTLSSLDAWVREEGVKAAERADREDVSKRILRASTLQSGGGSHPLHVMSLVLRGYANLTTLPPGLVIHGDLTLRGLIRLPTVSANLVIKRDITLVDCPALAELPKDLKVDGYVRVIRCTALTVWPDIYLGEAWPNMYRGEALCAATTNSPRFVWPQPGPRWRFALPLTAPRLAAWVNATLNPLERTERRHVAAEIRRAATPDADGVLQLGNLDLSSYNTLTDLPEGLCVAGTLILYACPALAAWPKGLRVRGDLRVIDCPGLTKFPKSALGAPRSDGVRRHIYTRGLSWPALLDLQLHAPIPGIQIHDPWLNSPAPFDTLTEAVSFWLEKAKSDLPNLQQAILPLNGEQDYKLKKFLGGLRATADYGTEQHREGFAMRVVEMLRAMRDPAMRALALERIVHSNPGCSDSFALMLNHLDVALGNLAMLDPQVSEEQLRQRGVAMLKLDVVHRFAAETLADNPGLDHVDVYLGFETLLAEPLGLPVSNRTTVMGRHVVIPNTALACASYQATTQASKPEVVEAYLQNWEPWQLYAERKRRAKPPERPAEAAPAVGFDLSRLIGSVGRAIASLNPFGTPG